MAKKIASFDSNLTEEYQIIGISSHLKEYKLCWSINNDLSLNLFKYNEFLYSGKKKQEESFSFYYYWNQLYRTEFFLLSNKNDKSILLDQLPQADFLLLVKNSSDAFMAKDLILIMKKIVNILTVFIVDPASIKDINYFLSEIELHQAHVIKKIE